MYRIYNVQSGEIIEDIAHRLLITSDDLRRINGFDLSHDVQSGDQIVVPLVRQPFFDVYKVMQGDTLYNIAKRYNMTVNDLALINGLDENDYIYLEQDILVPKINVEFYITKNSDTLSSAAENFKISTSELIKENPIIYLLPEQLLINKKEK